VVVEFQGQDFGRPQVIGFKSNPKACGFSISLTRGDGQAVDNTISFWLDVYNSSGTWIATTKTYSPGTPGHWKVELVDPDDADPNGYWFEYGCEYGLWEDGSQYPYRYKAADKRNIADLIPLKGHFTDTIPYWRAATPTYNQTVAAGLTSYYDPERLEKTVTVYSSVPFRATYGVYKREGYQRRGLYGPIPYDTHSMDCPNHDLGGTYAQGGLDDPVQVSCQDGGLSVSMGVDGAGTGESTTTVNVDYAANVSGEPLVMTVTNVTPGGTKYHVDCSPGCPVGGYDLPIAGLAHSVYIIGITPVYDY
jgi:hypothetical protein